MLAEVSDRMPGMIRGLIRLEERIVRLVSIAIERCGGDWSVFARISIDGQLRLLMEKFVLTEL